MKLVSKIIGTLLVLAGLAVAIFGINLSMNNLNSVPVLLEPAVDAQNRAAAMMDAVAAGDYETAGTIILGNPKLGVDRDAKDLSGRLIWKAFVESYEYELVGDCYATDSGVAQNIRVTYLDISSVTRNLKERTHNMLNERVENAEESELDLIYDENDAYREDFVMGVLEEAVRIALQEDAVTTSAEFTVNLVYRNGNWMVVSDQSLLNAISGGIVK